MGSGVMPAGWALNVMHGAPRSITAHLARPEVAVFMWAGGSRTLPTPDAYRRGAPCQPYSVVSRRMVSLPVRYEDPALPPSPL